MTLELKLALALAELVFVILIGAACYGWGHHNETLVYNAYVSKQDAAAQKQVGDNKTALLKQQQDDAAAMTALNDNHQEQLRDLQKANENARADAIASTSKLRQYITSTSRQPADVPDAAASGSVAAGTGAAPLRDGVSDLDQWLTSQWYDADQLTLTVTALQQIVTADRKTCNGSLPGVTPQ